MTDRLRALWDFDDLDGTEKRLRGQLADETTDSGRAEVTAELARVHGLRGAFDEGDALLDEAATLAGGAPAVTARLDLERGRLRRSSLNPDAARPLFESAYAEALETEQHFLAADAAHMVALVAESRDGFVEWTHRGVELAERHEEAAYWLGPLLNNLGWEYYEAGNFESALDAFERALRAREADGDNPHAVEIARYAVGKTLRALDRAQEAIPLLEAAVTWAEANGVPDGWFHEELAEEYAAAGRTDEARTQAKLAIPLLERDDPSFSERSARLDALASG
ncbi:MAG TPA: tetratricopeptide repeat protein [Gaiellaceae bacterium]|nr:tetratricopeptide repeat protein [Gaiellaceae bacterium]